MVLKDCETYGFRRRCGIIRIIANLSCLNEAMYRDVSSLSRCDVSSLSRCDVSSLSRCDVSSLSRCDVSSLSRCLSQVQVIKQHIQKQKSRNTCFRLFAVTTRLELATPGVTGRYSNQLNYVTFLK
jgi:hypothetical protein